MCLTYSSSDDLTRETAIDRELFGIFANLINVAERENKSDDVDATKMEAAARGSSSFEPVQCKMECDYASGLRGSVDDVPPPIGKASCALAWLFECLELEQGGVGGDWFGRERRPPERKRGGEHERPARQSTTNDPKIGALSAMWGPS